MICSFKGVEAQNLGDEVCVPLDTFEDIMDGLVSTFSLEWTNVGAYNKKKKNWIDQKSVVDLGALGRYKEPIPTIKHKIGSKVYYEHLNKWSVKKGGMSAKIVKHKKFQWALRITVNYESEGSEIIVKCYDKKTKKPCGKKDTYGKGHIDKVKIHIYAAVRTKKNSPNIKFGLYRMDGDVESRFGKKLLKTFGHRKDGWIGKKKKTLKTLEIWVLDYLVDFALHTIFDFNTNELVSGYLVDQDEHDVSSLFGLADIPFAGLIDKNILEKLKITQVTKKKNAMCLKYKLPLSALFSQ